MFTDSEIAVLVRGLTPLRLFHTAFPAWSCTSLGVFRRNSLPFRSTYRSVPAKNCHTYSGRYQASSIDLDRDLRCTL